MPLYNEIGEEYDIDIDEVKSYFDFEHCVVVPNESFISIVVISLPTLETRDVSINEIVLSYLNSLNDFESIESITKINDTNFQNMAIEYYKEIIDIEMDMRNILTYMITYDNRRINEDLFKSFGIKVSEKLTADKIKKNYENGLFYILFKDYKSFLDIEPLNSNDIAKLLQSNHINSFEDFKDSLRTKITEERHLNFLSSVEKSFSQLDNIRNSIMHIHSLSTGEMKSYEKIMFDNGMNKSLKSQINDFWEHEQTVLKEQTLLALAKKYVKTIFEKSDYQDGKLHIDEAYQNDAIEEEYIYEDIKNDVMAYIEDEVNIFGDELFEDIVDELIAFINSCWNEITTNE